MRHRNHKIQYLLFIRNTQEHHITPIILITKPTIVPFPQACRFDYVFTTILLVMFLLLRDKSSEKTFKSHYDIQLYYAIHLT